MSPDPATVTRPPPEDVTAVIVTFNSARTIAACLGALPPAVPVIVVDNASRDDTLALVARARPDAVILRNGANEGYGRGNNRGMAQVKTPYGLILNPDAMVDRDALDRLVAAARRNPDAAMIAPLLGNPAGRPELPVMGPGETTHRPADWEPAGDFCTWFLTGAVLLCDMAAWRAVGGFDEAIFLYNEDTDLSLRCRARGFALVVTPAARVAHVGGGSAAGSWRGRWIRDWHMTWSHYYVQGKHGADTAALRQAAWRQATLSAWRAVLYSVLLNPGRVWGNAAKAAAAFAYARGRPSRKE